MSMDFESELHLDEVVTMRGRVIRDSSMQTELLGCNSAVLDAFAIGEVTMTGRQLRSLSGNQATWTYLILKPICPGALLMLHAMSSFQVTTHRLLVPYPDCIKGLQRNHIRIEARSRKD